MWFEERWQVRFSLFESAICFTDAIEKSANKEESSEGDESPISCEDRNLEPSLVEMLDGVIMLYHIAVHKQLSKVEGRLSVNLTFFSDRLELSRTLLTVDTFESITISLQLLDSAFIIAEGENMTQF